VAALAVAFSVGLFVRPRIAAGDTAKIGPGVGTTAASPTEVSMLQTRVAQLEKKLDELQRQDAALQKQFAVHTHKFSRQALDCTTYTVLMLKRLLDNPGGDANARICLSHPSANPMVEANTTGPVN
jgi:hypothetical protein